MKKTITVTKIIMHSQMRLFSLNIIVNDFALYGPIQEYTDIVKGICLCTCTSGDPAKDSSLLSR